MATPPTSTEPSPSPSSPLSSSSSSSSAAPHTPSSYFASLARRRQQKKMSITQTYYLAHTARKKLTREASRADHDLRLLVGHANLLDSLMLDLADAEQEQERWFNQTVSGVSKSSPASSSSSSDSRHIQWAETIVEDPEEDDWDPEDASDADSDVSDDSDDLSDDSDDLSDDEYEYDYDYEPTIYTAAVKRPSAPVAVVTEKEVQFQEDDDDDDSDSDSDFEYDDAENLDDLALTRSPSRQSPPELLLDSDEESEEDSMPPSPPQPTLDSFAEEKQPQATETEIPLSDSGLDGYYEPNQTQSTAVIEAY